MVLIGVEMSNEKELLRRVVSSNWQIGTIPVVLHEEIEALLAQPEPFKPDWVNYRQGVEDGMAQDKPPHQEPVAWQLSSKDSSYTELRKAEPEGADMYLYQIKPLYLALPKREPLSVDKILTLSKCYTDRLNFARAIENEHGI